MNKTNQKLKTKTPSFQSDIVIDENGEVHISFFGPELLHLVDSRRSDKKIIKKWYLPDLSQEDVLFKLDTLKDEYKNCLLCPKQCGFNRVSSVHPNCGDWTLKVSNYGISFGDEPEISNGGGSGVIFLSGCPLTCPSCINNEKVRAESKDLTVVDFLHLVENLQHQGVNNIQILSPTVSLPHLRFALKILKKHSFPIPIILKSSGYESSEQIKKFKGLVDIYVPDYKFSSSCYWKKQSGADDYQEVFEQCLDEMYQQTGPFQKDENGIIQRGVIIRHVKNPYVSATELKKIEDLLDSKKANIFISIMDNFVVLD